MELDHVACYLTGGHCHQPEVICTACDVNAALGDQGRLDKARVRAGIKNLDRRCQKRAFEAEMERRYELSKWDGNT
jgi:hypothetical protein